MRDLIYENSVYSETKALLEVVYKSKEALFQYKDKKHFDEWEHAIENLRKASITPGLAESVYEYHKIHHDIIDVILAQNIIFSEIEKHMETYIHMLKKIDKNSRLLTEDMNRSMDKINKNLYFKFILTMVILLLFSITLGIFIHTQLIRPLEKLKNSTDEIAKMNFNHKITIYKDDEIGQLASHFNSMIDNLKFIYLDLENMVKERNMGLEESNSKLLKEVYEREKLEKKLKNQVITDELTGLFNRRAAYTFLSDEIKRSKMQGYSLTICYLDIDNFKNINDNLGHEEGDRYLKEFSQILKLNLRQEDYIFRMGGDEFIAAFPNKHKKGVEIIFEKRVLPELKSKLNIEFSYGILEFSEHKNLSLDEIIKKTDRNMYKNKLEKKKEASISLNPSFV